MVGITKYTQLGGPNTETKEFEWNLVIHPQPPTHSVQSAHKN